MIAMRLLLLLMTTVLAVLLGAGASAGELEIVHINVGQGDATLILGPETEFRDRVAVLMDAGDIPMDGDRDGGDVVYAVLQRYGLDELDFFIASHYDADHIGGVITGMGHIHGGSFVLGPNGVPGGVGDDDGDGTGDWLDSNETTPDPEELWTGDDVRVLHFIDRGDQSAPDTATYRKYKAIADAAPSRTSVVTRADVEALEIDLGDGAVMRCYAANGHVRGRSNRVRFTNTENERSLCFLVTYRGFDYLIGGDTIGRSHGSENARVEKAIGEALHAGGVEVDVLHVNHHGANNGSEAEFLDLVRPEVAVISLGDFNDHGHPHADALARLADAGVAFIYQTENGTTEDPIDWNALSKRAVFRGDIVLRTDGEQYEISTSRAFMVDE